MFRGIDDCVNLDRALLHPVNSTDLMYADDTALITNNCNAMNRLLGEIEFQAEYYGLNFNKDMCEFRIQPKYNPTLLVDGTEVPKPFDAMYLEGKITYDTTHHKKLPRESRPPLPL